MSAPEKAEVVTKVSSSPLPKRKVLRELGIPKSTYYRWLRRQDQQGLEDRPGGGQPPWNRLTIREERSVLLSAREMPELSCRQLAAWITDNQGFSVSESSVYRILGSEGNLLTYSAPLRNTRWHPRPEMVALRSEQYAQYGIWRYRTTGTASVS